MKNGANPINPILDWNEVKADSIGLTRREYFAGLAMQGILSGNEINRTGRKTAVSIVEMSLNLADELLKQLEK